MKRRKTNAWMILCLVLCVFLLAGIVYSYIEGYKDYLENYSDNNEWLTFRAAYGIICLTLAVPGIVFSSISLRQAKMSPVSKPFFILSLVSLILFLLVIPAAFILFYL